MVEKHFKVNLNEIINNTIEHCVATLFILRSKGFTLQWFQPTMKYWT